MGKGRPGFKVSQNSQRPGFSRRKCKQSVARRQPAHLELGLVKTCQKHVKLGIDPRHTVMGSINPRTV